LFAHSYVWCSNNSSTSIALPKGVAIPLWEVSVALDVPPVLTQLTIVLSNYRLLDSDASVCMENLATLVNFFGGRDESWFYLVTAEVEASGAKAIMPLLLLQHAIEQHQDTHGEDAALLDVAAGYLATSASAIKDMVTSFKKVREACHPVIFYQRVRPFLAGWRCNPALPGGLRYEGVKVRWEDRHATNENHIEEGADITTCPPQEFYGGSAAQSSLLPFLDIMLGVEHDNKNGSYLTAMREYMYRPHREFLAHLERTTSTKTNIRQFLNHLSLPSPAADKVKAAYNECLEHLQTFRTAHISVVAEYIMSQQKNGVSTNSIEGNAGGKGTGGTDLMQFLKPLRDDVKNSVV